MDGMGWDGMGCITDSTNYKSTASGTNKKRRLTQSREKSFSNPSTSLSLIFAFPGLQAVKHKHLDYEDLIGLMVIKLTRM